jgi:Arc/MetJ-type ribon-helix-helix transcriptional regulator
MSTDLSHDAEAFLSDSVSRGVFPSRVEALEAGVKLLRQRQQFLERVAEGRRQLDEGEYVEFDDDGLKQFFGKFARSRRRTRQRQVNRMASGRLSPFDKLHRRSRWHCRLFNCPQHASFATSG